MTDSPSWLIISSDLGLNKGVDPWTRAMVHGSNHGFKLQQFPKGFYGKVADASHRPQAWAVGHPTIHGWKSWVAPVTSGNPHSGLFLMKWLQLGLVGGMS